MTRLAEGWLLAVVIVAGLSLGSLGLLAIGRLLGRGWVEPLQDEIKPTAMAISLAGLLAAPLGFFFDDLYRLPRPASAELAAWFDGDVFLLRSLAYFLLWTALALFLVRRARPRWNAIGLILLAPTAALAGIDWVLGRPPFWWSSLFGFAFAASQLGAALAFVFLANAAQREPVSFEQHRSLVSALLTLALLTLWLWFVQFLAAFMADLPDGAGWYLARLEEGRWPPLAIAAALLGAAILLLVQAHRGRATVLAASALIIAQHLLHSAWLLRPAGTPPLGWMDLPPLLLVGGIWLLIVIIGMRRQDALRSDGTSGGQTAVSSG